MPSTGCSLRELTSQPHTKGVKRSSNPIEPKGESPGPGQYDGATAIGRQVESHKATITEPSFPVTTRDDSANVSAWEVDSHALNDWH